MTIAINALKTEKGPLYRQIADALAEQINAGLLLPGSKLPTHRRLADQLHVTVGTITRAYGEVERRGLVEARVGAGTYVRDHRKANWVFSNDLDNSQCELGFNIPPSFDRSQMMQQAMSALTEDPRQINHLLLYHSAAGIAEHRETMVGWLSTLGLKLSSDRLLFTSGAQNATQLVLSAFSRAGDNLLVENLTYPGLISLARQQQLTLKPVAMDDQGLLPEALDNACRQYQPRFLYSMPTLQNPTTAVMGLQRRQEILDVCRQHNVYLIEDDVNGLLPEHRPEAMVNLDQEHVIYVGALSKFLAPGLRVGYVHAPEALYKQLMSTIQNQCWMVSPLLTGLACQLIEQGSADQTLHYIRQDIRQRRQLVCSLLADTGIQTAEDCFHAWLPVPEAWSLSDFLAALKTEGIAVKSAELFVPPGYAIPPAVRLSFSAPDNLDTLTSGLKTIKSLLATQPVAEFSL
ncbi:PLP-dependent aminotransferase family protein [Endozoicomonas ascidiicola]|uniref:aminotransferase-like domain-containing protein n=1 Tax=Endozoicomonas ascidiicola TaxID=1698521 RepID=UPI00082C1D50|nr:PLP-dependent aminotransferase family protein [Endozoicomonas ascidiicola]